MGAYTEVFIVPESDRDWRSDPTAIRWILEYLGCDRLHSISGYEKPYYWDDPEERLGKKVIPGQALTVDEAMAVLTNSGAPFVFMELRCGDSWRERFCAEVESLPEDVCDDYWPRNVSLCVGPFSLPDPDHESTLGRYRLGLFMHGDDMPPDWDIYLDHFRKLGVVQDLIDALSKQFGIPWNLVMCSYY